MPLTPNSQYWVPHEEHAFLPCTFSGTNGDMAEFQSTLGDGEDIRGVGDLPKTKASAKIAIKVSEAEGLATVSQAQLEGVDNICSLEEVTKASVLHTVRTRYVKATPQVYTRVARIMIAVNPFKSLPIYGGQVMKRYMEAADTMELPPHLYAIGADAVTGLRQEERLNQAVLISGESGAGKTESTKLVLSYVSEVLDGSTGGIQDKIMQTNPVLESFGNAMTVRNNNSSRFGKWLQIAVSKSCSILGCSVTDYLLELTRVVKQGELERNYHVFFQLIQARDGLKDHMTINDPSTYRYIKDSQYKAPNVDDQQCFEELREAFDTLGFDFNTQLEIFKTVIGILTLGNIEFLADGEGCKLKDDEAISACATLFGIQADALRKMMVTRLIKVAGDVTEAHRTPAQADQARDSLARLLYGRLFKYLIAKINKQLSEDAPVDGQYFGVLDIAGFESFETNSIEQLFINLSNEHLQAHFNNHIFKMELDDYKAEGIEVGDGLKYQDNSDIIALLDSKTSILAVLDEEVSVPKATDQTFLAKVVKTFDKHARIIIPKIGGGKTFGVNHFAGPVTYTVDSFLEKNVDKPPDEAPDLLTTSSHAVLKEIGSVIAAEIKEAQAPGRKKVKTVSSTFRQSLASLVEKLNMAEPHFIRCIKPNQSKVPSQFTAKIVMDQLTCSGVFEAVRIRQSGYPTRVPFAEFLSRYRTVASKSVQKKLRESTASDADKVKMFLEAIREIIFGDDLEASGDNAKSVSDKDLILGKSKVFARTKVMTELDQARDLALSIYVSDIQRVFRGFIVRKMMKGVKVVFAELAQWRKDNPFYEAHGPEHTAVQKLKTADAIDGEVARLDVMLEKAKKLPLPVPQAKQIEKQRHRMEQEGQTIRQLQAVLTSIEPIEIDKLVARAQDLEITIVPEVDQLKARSEALKVQVPLIKGIENSLAEKDLDDMEECMAAVKKNGLNQRPENWLKELKGEQMANQLYSTMEQIKAQQKQEELKRKQEEEERSKKAKLDEASNANVQTFEMVDPEEEKRKKEEEKKKKAKEEKKKRKSTITGLSENDQTQILLSLIRAMETYDLPKLEESLKKAHAEGVQEQETMQDAQALFSNMEHEDFLIEKLEEQEELLKMKNDESRALKSIQNLVSQAVKLEVAETAVEKAKKVLQERVRMRARNTIKGQIFDEIDLDYAELVDSAFEHLLDYQGLKSPSSWKGHKSWAFFVKGDSGPEVMVKHNKMDIRESLTPVGHAFENQACMAYHNILGWMYDRPLPSQARNELMRDVLAIAHEHDKLANEIYVQVMKQLTENPSPRSAAQGWKLMLGLCQTVAPSEDLQPFVHVFLMKMLAHEYAERDFMIQADIKQCSLDLNALTNKAKDPNSKGEVDDDVTLQVLLIDNSTRKVTIKSSTDLAQLGVILADQLRINKPQDFAFFQVTSGLDSHRLLPDNAIVSQLLAKWSKLKEMTQRVSNFLWKRKFLKLDEHLTGSSRMHAQLTYKQALYDFLHYPFCENLPFLYEIAVRILWMERHHFREEIDGKKLDNPGVLEVLLPEPAIKSYPRRKLATELQQLYLRVQKHMDESEARLVTQQRILKLMQRMRLFGAYFWHGRQIKEVSADKVSIKESRYDQARGWWAEKYGNGAKADRQVCCLNTKNPEGEYWIAVDFFGVRFLAEGRPGAGSPPDAAPFYRGFLFNEDHIERVLMWGARQNVLQLIVTTLETKDKKVDDDGLGKDERKRVPMMISMSTPAAVDIAYAIQTMYQLRGWQTCNPGTYRQG